MEQSIRELKYWLNRYLKALINDAVDLHAKKFRKVEYCSLPQVRSLDNTQKVPAWVYIDSYHLHVLHHARLFNIS